MRLTDKVTTWRGVKSWIKDASKKINALSNIQIVRSGLNDSITTSENGIIINLKKSNHTVNNPSGGERPYLWDVTLTGVELDPLTLMKSVLDDLITNWNNAIPSEGDFDTVIDSLVSNLTRSSTPPASVSSSIENLFNNLQGVIDSIQSTADGILNNVSPISTTLGSFFESLERYPKDGDYIYNDVLGIAYTVFEKRTERPAGTANPSGNLIFRVEFSVTLNAGEENEQTKNFTALTLFPAPDIGGLLETLLNYVLKLIELSLANGISSVLTGLASGILSGLNNLYNELLNIINSIPAFDPTYLENAIDALELAMQAVEDRLDIIELAQDALEQALDALEATIDGSVTVKVIGADGNYHTIKVQEDTTGTSAKQEITWIQSSDGTGRRASFLVDDSWSSLSNIEDIDWRQINYIHPDGTTYQMQCLVKITNNEPFDDTNANYTITAIEVCTATGKQSKNFLLQDSTP